jgi:pSer/pThr/pTyr-binding forkhead associated (FHA) protein
MKLSLVVMSQGKGAGKVIPITLSQFLIGRDPQCHLRPASPVISKRHCALLVRGGKVFLRDFGSTNGTFVNERQVKGEIEIHSEDRLTLGPLSFVVRIETGVAPTNPTPPPAPAAAAPQDDESIAAMLLSLHDEGGAAAGKAPGEDGIPEGSTVMDVPSPLQNEQGETQPADKKKEPAKPEVGNTSSAAKAILEKYARRQRT